MRRFYQRPEVLMAIVTLFTLIGLIIEFQEQNITDEISRRSGNLVNILAFSAQQNAVLSYNQVDHIFVKCLLEYGLENNKCKNVRKDLEQQRIYTNAGTLTAINEATTTEAFIAKALTKSWYYKLIRRLLLIFALIIQALAIYIILKNSDQSKT